MGTLAAFQSKGCFILRESAFDALRAFPFRSVESGGIELSNKFLGRINKRKSNLSSWSESLSQFDDNGTFRVKKSCVDDLPPRRKSPSELISEKSFEG